MSVRVDDVRMRRTKEKETAVSSRKKKPERAFGIGKARSSLSSDATTNAFREISYDCGLRRSPAAPVTDHTKQLWIHNGVQPRTVAHGQIS